MAFNIEDGTMQMTAIHAVIMIVLRNCFSLRIRMCWARLLMELCKTCIFRD